MSQKELAYKIEDLQSKAEMINSLQNTLYAAIYCQDVFSKNDFDRAFNLLGNMTFDIAKELQKLTECAFEIFRGQKEVE